MKTLLIVLVLFVVIPLMVAQPVKIRIVRRTCGRDLVDRVNRICEDRGGHMTYTRVRRVRRGIVDECCMNICPDYHLYAYCSNDKQERVTKSSESESSIETPVVPADLEVSESQAPESMALVSSINTQNDITQTVDSITSSPNEKATVQPDHHGYSSQNIVMNSNSNIDSDYVQQLIKTLPYSSNDFQVGTVPPEYRIIPKKYLIPSHARLFN